MGYKMAADLLIQTSGCSHENMLLNGVQRRCLNPSATSMLGGLNTRDTLVSTWVEEPLESTSREP